MLKHAGRTRVQLSFPFLHFLLRQAHWMGLLNTHAHKLKYQTEQQIFTNRCQSESAPWVTGRVSDQSCWSCLPEPYAPFHQWWRPSPPPLQTQTILLILINYCTYKRNSHGEMWQPDGCCGFVTLICAVVEDVEGFHRCRAPLFVTKDQINPLVEVGWHILWFL